MLKVIIIIIIIIMMMMMMMMMMIIMIIIIIKIVIHFCPNLPACGFVSHYLCGSTPVSHAMC